MADRIGLQFGNYRLVRLLDRGGFAEVYLGEHIHLETQAAIKLLTAELDSKEQKQFREEARLIAHLDHEHIVPVLEFGIENTTPFLVMKYAPNGTLRNRHPERTQVSLTTVVPYVKQIADALQYAHDRKIIHRDLKPKNILIGNKNELMLSDFGISIVAHDFHSLTPQIVIGTPCYMAPEQWQGKAVLASDQYSLGVMIYEWLCGEPPFSGDVAELMYKHIHVPPFSLCEKMPSISPAVNHVVMKSLEKDPANRYRTIQAFAWALEQTLVSRIPPTIPAKSVTPKPTASGNFPRGSPVSPGTSRPFSFSPLSPPARLVPGPIHASKPLMPQLQSSKTNKKHTRKYWFILTSVIAILTLLIVLIGNAIHASLNSGPEITGCLTGGVSFPGGTTVRVLCNLATSADADPTKVIIQISGGSTVAGSPYNADSPTCDTTSETCYAEIQIDPGPTTYTWSAYFYPGWGMFSSPTLEAEGTFQDTG